MARIRTTRDALNEALHQEMERDPSIVAIGLDIAGGTGSAGEQDAWGGANGVTRGLWRRFGPARVLDTPISETAYLGTAVGAAASGLRPVVELMYNDFIGVCFDQLMNQAAKFRYMFGGKTRTPVVVRTAFGAGFRAGAQHSQSLHALFTHVPGLKCVIPSNPYDAKGLLMAAIRDDDPVVFLEHQALYDNKGAVPEEPYAIPFAEASIVREGTDVTVVATGRMVQMAAQAVTRLAADGIECELIDPRTTSPLDTDSILESIESTGRLVVVDEGAPRCGFAADVAALAATEAFGALRAPVQMVTPPHTPVPFAPELEDLYIPDPDRIAAAVHASVRAGR